MEKKNLHSLLVGMSTSITTMESSMAVPQKTKNGALTSVAQLVECHPTK